MTIKDFFKKLFSPMIWINLTAMLVVVLLALGFVWKGMLDYTNHDITVELPQTTGMDSEDAQQMLQQLGLNTEIEDTIYDSKLKRGQIASMVPEAGSKVKPGRTVRLTIVTNHRPKAQMPDLADNSSRREAIARLQAIGWKVSHTEYIPGEPDWVYEVKANGRTIQKGEWIEKGTQLTLVVGNGSANLTSDSLSSDSGMLIDPYDNPYTDDNGTDDGTIEGFEL